MTPTTRDAYDLFHRSTLMLADMEENGICVDEDYCKKQIKSLGLRMQHFKEQTLLTSDGREWKRRYGAKVNIDSDTQLSKMLFTVLGLKPSKFTAKGNPAVDKEALSTIKRPIIKPLLKFRQASTAQDKLIEIQRETVDGLLHPHFGLNIPRSYRGSCENPNFQNVAKRDAWIAEIVRTAIRASFGNQLGEFDGKGMEVCTAACCSRDPVLIEYVEDDTKDMHRDLAMRCFALKKNQVSKLIRYCGKNMFVFPEFYGDYFVHCATNMWEAIKELKLELVDGTPLREHLRDQGLGTYRKFEKNVEAAEDWFWHEKFKAFHEYREDIYKLYLKTGKVELVTGFTCHEVMSKNQALNRPIQGPAFHCLLWVLCELNDLIKSKQWGTTLIAQIHDSGIADIVPEERDTFLKASRKIVRTDLMDHWDWIITPFDIEMKIAPIDGSWWELDDYEL